MNKIVFILMMTLSFSVSSAGDVFNFHRWCNNQAQSLRAALADGQQTRTYEDEIKILRVAVRSSLRQRSKKTEKYFRYTLELALSDQGLYRNDLERQVEAVRFYINEAIHDLEVLGQKNSLVDHGDYVVEILQRAIKMGTKSREANNEVKILTLGVERALDWLTISDYRRTNSYACAAVSLQNVLDQLNDEYETMTLLSVLRNGIYRALNYINYNC